MRNLIYLKTITYINLNCALDCPCRENRFTQTNLGSSASEIPNILSF